MLFSKLKSRSDELLPPPPPFPSMELEEEKHDASGPKHKASKDNNFESLAKEVQSLKPKSPKKSPGIKAKAAKAIAKPAIKKELKKLAKNASLPKSKLSKAKAAKLPNSRRPKKEAIGDLDFILPKDMPKDFEIPEIEMPEEIDMPDKLEDLDIGNEFEAGNELSANEQNAKPREIEEAEDEIKSAIEKIKQSERPSLFKKIFGKDKPAESPEIHGYDASSIQNMISSAREALMRFDLEAAKKGYIEIMRIYNKIRPEEQAKVYHDVRDLYFERKSAEEMKV